MSHCIYDQATLEARCAYWQKRLRLQDWEIDVTLQRQREFANEDAIGWVLPFDEQKKARIRLLDSVDWPEGNSGFTPHLDHEYTLVHELLHIHFWKGANESEDNPQAHLVDELGVFLVAHTLVQLDRELREALGEETLGMDLGAGLLGVEDDADGDRGDADGDGDVPVAPDDGAAVVLRGARVPQRRVPARQPREAGAGNAGRGR